jgi:hypothetical protein
MTSAYQTPPIVQEDALPEYEAALALDRNLVGALINLGQCSTPGR